MSKSPECEKIIEKILTRVDQILTASNGQIPEMQRGDIMSIQSSVLRFQSMWVQAPDPDTLGPTERQKVGHGMRNALGVITGYTLMLLEGMAGEVEPTLRAAVDEVYMDSEKLLETVNSHYHGNY